MARRPNGAGSMYRRGQTYYARMKIQGKYVRMSLGTSNKEEARKRLDHLARGHDLSDEERLAALMVHFKPKNSKRDFEEAWDAYAKAPENAAQTEGAREGDHGSWKRWMYWLHGHETPYGRFGHDNFKATHPEVVLLCDVSPQIASEFVEWLRSHRSPQTANKTIRILRRVWRLNNVEENPWIAFRKFKVEASKRRAFTREEVDRIIDSAEGEMKTLFIIGAYTGLRLSDCRSLRYEFIDTGAGVIRTGKTGKVVRIPLHPRLKAALGDRKKNGFVLPELSTWPKWKVSAAVQAHFQALGFETRVKHDGYNKSCAVVGFHSLRSTFITRLGEAGVPLPVVRDMVGHVSEEMTMRYFRSDDAMAKKAIAALG